MGALCCKQDEIDYSQGRKRKEAKANFQLTIQNRPRIKSFPVIKNHW